MSFTIAGYRKGGGDMYESTVRIDDMMCSMCEAHVNDALRGSLNVNKVSSSHKKGETVIISENEISVEQVSSALDGSGYAVTDLTCEPYEKKRLFGRK